jgi:hypothetical protein
MEEGIFCNAQFFLKLPQTAGAGIIQLIFFKVPSGRADPYLIDYTRALPKQ